MKIENHINKLINDDCLNVLEQIPDNSIDFILTDPPYFIAQEASLIRRSNKMKYKGKDILFDEKWDRMWKNREEYKKWLIDLLKIFYRILKDDKHVVIWCDKMLAGFLMEEGEKIGFKYRSPFFWKKTNPVPRARKCDMMKSIEEAVWLTKNKVKQNNYNWQLGMFTDVIELPIPQKEGCDERHPTLKPLFLGLFLTALLTKPNDICLDPFAGHFTLSLSAKLLNRKWIGIEKEKKYFDIGKKKI